MANVAVTGASGFLGARVVDGLERAGHVVRRLQRSSAAGSVRFVLSEPVDPKALQHIEVLIHCAYDYDPPREDPNVVGSEVLLEAARAQGVDHVVFMSSLQAFSGCKSAYGQAKLATEAPVLASGGTVLRLGTLYDEVGGQARGGVRGETLRQLQTLAGRVPVLPVPTSRTPSIFLSHVEDVATLVCEVVAGRRASPSGPVAAANDAAYTLGELVRVLRRLVDGKRLRTVAVPWRLAWAPLRAAEHIGLRSGLRSESLEMLFDLDPHPPFEALAAFETRFRRL